MESFKKQRSENWNVEEKELLRQIVADSAHIVETKSTKSNVNIEKVKEWKNITNKFNEVTGKTRSCEQIKLAWKRMKLTAKANLSVHRQQQCRTGGGEKPPSPSQEELLVMAIGPHDFVIDCNEFDSDAVKDGINTTQQEIVYPTTTNIEPIIVVETIEPKTPTKQGTPRKTPRKTPRNSPKKGKNNVSQYTTHIMKETIVDSNIAFKKRFGNVRDRT